MKVIVTIVIGVIVIMCAFGMTAFSAMDLNEEKFLALDAVDEIQVEMRTEPINIFQTDGNEMKVRLYGKAAKGSKIISEIKNNTLVLGLERKGFILDIAVDIFIPKSYVKNISLKNASGGVKLDSVNFAKVTINIGSGETNLKNVNAKQLTLKGGSGIVRASYQELQDQNLSMEVTSGSIIFELPSTAEFSLKAKSTKGKVQCDFPIPAVGSDNRTFEGQIGTKNNKISLQSTTGTIKIVKK